MFRLNRTLNKSVIAQTVVVAVGTYMDDSLVKSIVMGGFVWFLLLNLRLRKILY